MADPVATGARVLVLTTALEQPDIGEAEIGLPLTWRAGPANRNVADASFVEETVTLTGKCQRPLSPVHIAARRPNRTEDIALSWIRRSRIGGDSWNQANVPLGEASEAYDIEILNGEALVRELSATSPAVIYTAAQQTADWGAPLWIGDGPLSVRIYQRSETFGRGVPSTANLTFPLPLESA